jgi:hypothetical protein
MFCFEEDGLTVAQAQAKEQTCSEVSDGGVFHFQKGPCPRAGALGGCLQPNAGNAGVTDWYYKDGPFTLAEAKARCGQIFVPPNDGGTAAGIGDACATMDAAPRLGPPGPPLYEDPSCRKFTIPSLGHGTIGCCRPGGVCGVLFREEICGGKFLLPAQCIDPATKSQLVPLGDTGGKTCIYPTDGG